MKVNIISLCSGSGSQLHALQTGDAVLDKLKGEESVMDFDVNFGLFYKADRWNVGISGTQLITKARLSGDNSVLISTSERSLQIHRLGTCKQMLQEAEAVILRKLQG